MSDPEKRPKLSIVIVTWNTERFLRACLKSVYHALGSSTRAQIIVVDNASLDNTVSMMRNEFPDVHLIVNSENSGFVRANNRAFEMARGRFVLLLNPDTEICGQAIQAMVEWLEAHDETGVVGPLLFNADGTAQNSYFEFPGFVATIREYYLPTGFSHWWELPHRLSNRTKRVDVVRGACLLTRLTLLKEIGGLNNELFMYSEETDLCYKIRKLGFDVVFLPQSRVIHHERRSFAHQPDDFRSFHYLRSKIIFFRTNYPSWKSSLLTGLVRVSLQLKMTIYELFGQRLRGEYMRELIGKLTEEGLW